MKFTVLDLWTGLLAAVAFGIFILPTPYLFARATNLVAFRTRSGSEKLLWVLALALPFCIFGTSVLGRFISPRLLDLYYALAAIAAAMLLVPTLWATRRSFSGTLKALTPVLAAILAFLCYVLVITCSIQMHGHLYESANYTDWSVRVPMVSGAIRDGMPPSNPFFTVGGQPQPMHYYYYWYVLCALVGRTLQLPARACIAGSTFWSGLALMAVVFLALRHLLGFAPRSKRAYLWPLLLCCVLGVDIIAALIGYSLRPPAIFPDIEWWLDDRIPSFLGAVIFAPHHIAGVVCCITAFLMFAVHLGFPSESESPQGRVWLQRGAVALAAAVCFAACAGTSSFVALCFTFVGVFYALDLIRKRRWADLAIVGVAGALAVAFSVPYLRELTAATPGAPSGHHHVLEFELRNRREKEHFAGRLVFDSPTVLRDILYAFIAPALVPVQFGFLIVPLSMRIVTDIRRLRARQTFTPGERMLWCIFLGAALPGFFLSSAPAGVNDLGRHAGLILRFVLVCWSVPLLWPYFERFWRREQISQAHPSFARFAVVLFCIGLVSQCWQIIVNRGLMLFLAHHPKVMPGAPVAQEDDVGARFFQLREGLHQVESRLPAGAVVQSNPTDPFQTQVMLYSSHPFAAGDISCEASFGGDPRLCKPIVAQLHNLYYTSARIPYWAHVPYWKYPRPDPAQAAVHDFLQACNDQNLAAIVVQNADIVWTVQDSWVWQLKPLYANTLVRISAARRIFRKGLTRRQ